MKRIFSVLMMAVLLVTALGFSASPVRAAGSIEFQDAHFEWGKGVVFVFHVSGLRNKDVKDVTVFVNSTLYHLGCTINEDKMTCMPQGDLTEFHPQTGSIFFPVTGQIIYVTIPGKSAPQQKVVEADPCLQFQGLHLGQNAKPAC